MKEELELKKSCPIEGIVDDIIWDILCRLPTKACLNSKLVCKRWYAIITSPEFSALRRAHGRYISLLFVARYLPHFMLLDLDTTSSKQLLDRNSNLIIYEDAKIIFKPKFKHPNTKLEPVNECNGLLCFKTPACWSSFVICNLLTGQRLTVKQPYRVGYRPVSCGWGYSPVSHQYKILRILRPARARARCRARPRPRPSPRPSDENSYVAEIYTLGTHEWRRVDNNAPGEILYWFNAYLNGSLHGCCRSSNRIWSFNFDTEQFSLVPLSNEIMSTGDILTVSTFESFLCCTTYVPFRERGDIDVVRKVWIMKEYGNKDSWVNLYVSMPFRGSMPLFRPMKGGRMLVSFVGEELHTLCWNNVVFDCKSRGHHYMRVLKMLLYVGNTTFSQLPMKLMQEQRDPKSL